MASSESKKMILKLLIDAGNNKVLFAEAGKDFVDFIFSLLLLPLGSVIKLVNPQNTLGAIRKLHQSVENINDTYLVANLNKSILLQPTVSASAGASPLRLTGTVVTPQPIKTGHCTYCRRQVNISDRNTCISCGYGVTTGAGGASIEGFVNEVVTYMITDDLEVTPMSAISSIDRFILKKNVRLEKKEVVVGMEEGLALLAAALHSATPLTDVFFKFLDQEAKKAAGSV